MRKGWLMAGLMLICGAVWADDASLRRQAEVIVFGDILAASSLGHFKTNPPPEDQRSLRLAYSTLYTVEMAMAYLGEPPAQAESLIKIKALLTKLEALDESERAQYPELLQHLLNEHQHMRVMAMQAYRDMAPEEHAFETKIVKLGQNVSELLIDYQLRFYPEVNSIKRPYTEAHLKELIAEIDAGFNELMQRDLGATRKIFAQYRFVRNQILPIREQPISGVDFYLARVITDLLDLTKENDFGT